MQELWERLFALNDGSSSSFMFILGYSGLLLIFREIDLQHNQPEGGELLPTKVVYNATTKIVTVSQANHCIKVYSVLPLKDNESN